MIKFCPYPFTRILINPHGKVFFCCEGWSGVAIGDIFKEDFAAAWNSEAAKKIRQSILDGSFTFCKHDICPEILSGRVGQETFYRGGKQLVLERGPELISLNYDDSCNLYCESCRKERRMMPQTAIEKIIRFQESLLNSSLLDNAVRLTVSGAGEPFVSKVYAHLFANIHQHKYPHLKITFRTNGLLLTPANWDRLKNIHYAVDLISISVDAASGETYGKLRRGGDFNRLMENLAFLAKEKENSRFEIKLNFVVQEQNYREMPAFVQLAKKYRCDKVTFTRLRHWSAYTKEQYRQLAVHDPRHLVFAELKKIVNMPVFKESMVALKDLSNLLD